MQMQVGMKRHTILLLIFLCFLTNTLFAQKGEIYVVSVGVSNYQNISDLTLPEKDAKAIAELYIQDTDPKRHTYYRQIRHKGKSIEKSERPVQPCQRTRHDSVFF